MSSCKVPPCVARSAAQVQGSTCSCCVPQVLQFGLYEFIREEGNPGGVRKMKKGTEVWTHKRHIHPLLIPPVAASDCLVSDAC